MDVVELFLLCFGLDALEVGAEAERRQLRFQV